MHLFGDIQGEKRYNSTMLLTAEEQKQFQADPGGYIRKAIQKYVEQSPNNRFSIFPSERIWDDPLIGFADGYDPLFQEYKTIIGDFHATPREALDIYLDSAGIGKQDLSNISVISWVMPITEATRLSMKQEDAVCSLRWNYTRWEGQEFIFRLARYLVSLLESQGYIAVAPDLTRWWISENYPTALPPAGRSAISPTPPVWARSVSMTALLLPGESPYAPEALSVTWLYRPAPAPMPVTWTTASFTDRGLRQVHPALSAGAISEKGHDKIKCQAYLEGMSDLIKKNGSEKKSISASIIWLRILPDRSPLRVPDTLSQIKTPAGTSNTSRSFS
jgi:hypothetical protein